MNPRQPNTASSQVNGQFSRLFAGIPLRGPICALAATEADVVPVGIEAVLTLLRSPEVADEIVTALSLG
jgi:hypothetical protein